MRLFRNPAVREAFPGFLIAAFLLIGLFLGWGR